jgi:hypothetical protein
VEEGRPNQGKSRQERNKGPSKHPRSASGWRVKFILHAMFSGDSDVLLKGPT